MAEKVPPYSIAANLFGGFRYERQVKLLRTSLVILFVVPFLRAADTPVPEKDILAPEGYEVVHLPGIDGSVLKPKGWFFQHFGATNSYIYRMTKEDLSKKEGFLTGFTITIAPAVSKITHQEPSEYATNVLKDYPKVEIISKGAACTYPTGQGPCEQREWIVDQEIRFGGTELDPSFKPGSAENKV